MQKRVVLLCRVENGEKTEQKRMMDTLTAYAREREWKTVKMFSQTGTVSSMILYDLRLMAKFREYDYLLIEDFNVFAMPPDETMEEVRYLLEHGVEVKTIKDGDLTCDSLPMLFRQRFQIFAGGKVKARYIKS